MWKNGSLDFGELVPLRAAAVSFVAKQKKPKVGLETKVSKNFLPSSPLASVTQYRH